jgi:hypothetical protein
MLCAEILVRGKGGVAQIRAVAPLKPIRAALQRLVEQRTGTTVSGDSALGCKCQKAAMKLAGLNLMRTIKQASVAPQSLMREGHATKQARVAKLVSMAESGQLEEYGGWDGVVETIQNKRQAQLRAMVARGISEEVATNVVEKLLAEDEEIVTTAMHIVGDDEEEDEDEDDNEDEDEPDVETSGWNPFKRRKKRAPTVARRKPRQPPGLAGHGRPRQQRHRAAPLVEGDLAGAKRLSSGSAPAALALHEADRDPATSVVAIKSASEMKF